MNSPADEPLEIVADLKSRVSKVLGTDAVPGSEGWTLHDVLFNRIFGDFVYTLVFAHGARTQRAQFLPANAHDAPYARTEQFDFIYDPTQEGHRPADRAMIDGLLAWFKTTPLPATKTPPNAPTVNAPPKASAALTAEVKSIQDALSLAITNGEVAGFAGWSFAGVEVGSFPAGLVPSVKLARGGHALYLHLLPSGADSVALYSTDRYDVVYDDQRPAEGDRDHAVIEGVVAWLRKAFPAGERGRQLELARRRALRAKNLSHDPRHAVLAEEIEHRLRPAVASGELALPDGWTFDGVVVEVFRGAPVPCVRVVKGELAPVLRLVPRGSDDGAYYNTDRFDVLYDDDEWGDGATHDRALVEAMVAWLREAFPAGEKGRQLELARRRALREQNLSRDPQHAALAHEIDERLRPALASGELSLSDGWALDEVVVEIFRGAPVPCVRLAQGDRALLLRLLPSGAEAAAYYRTERFDVLYDDDEWGTGFTRDHAVIEQVVTWLREAFPVGEEARTRELARKRALRAQMVQADPELVALADEVAQRLRGALEVGEAALPEGCRFDGAEVELQQGVASPTVRFTQGETAVTFRLRPTDASSGAHLRTSRFDVLYDSAQNDWKLHETPLARLFVAWLEATFPGPRKDPEPEPVAAPEAPVTAPEPEPVAAPEPAPNEPTVVPVVDPAMAALAGEISAALTAALSTDALPNPEGWTLKHVAPREADGAPVVEVVLLQGERALSFHVMPSSPERRAYRRMTRLDLGYEDDADGAHFARDKAMIDAFSTWLAAWDAARV